MVKQSNLPCECCAQGRLRTQQGAGVARALCEGHRPLQGQSGRWRGEHRIINKCSMGLRDFQYVGDGITRKHFQIYCINFMCFNGFRCMFHIWGDLY